eukprot:3000219-Pyramimonas_sp.AAC.1
MQNTEDTSSCNYISYLLDLLPSPFANPGNPARLRASAFCTLWPTSVKVRTRSRVGKTNLFAPANRS